MKNLTPELIAKAKAAKSAEELFALAKANNVELTEEEAKTYFEQLNANGTVSDDELDAVAGGGSCPTSSEMPFTAEIFAVGRRGEVINGNTCPGCGGTIGTVQLLVPNHPDPGCPITIVCEKCQKIILYPVTGSAFRPI